MLTWGWFVVPIFGLPGLTLVQAIGISIVVGLVTGQVMPRDSTQDPKDLKKLVFSGIYTPLISLALGWIVHFLM